MRPCFIMPSCSALACSWTICAIQIRKRMPAFTAHYSAASCESVRHIDADVYMHVFLCDSSLKQRLPCLGFLVSDTMLSWSSFPYYCLTIATFYCTSSNQAWAWIMQPSLSLNSWVCEQVPLDGILLSHLTRTMLQTSKEQCRQIPPSTGTMAVTRTFRALLCGTARNLPHRQPLLIPPPSNMSDNVIKVAKLSVLSTCALFHSNLSVNLFCQHTGQAASDRMRTSRKDPLIRTPRKMCLVSPWTCTVAEDDVHLLETYIRHPPSGVFRPTCTSSIQAICPNRPDFHQQRHKAKPPSHLFLFLLWLSLRGERACVERWLHLSASV